MAVLKKPIGKTDKKWFHGERKEAIKKKMSAILRVLENKSDGKIKMYSQKGEIITNNRAGKRKGKW